MGHMDTLLQEVPGFNNIFQFENSPYFQKAGVNDFTVPHRSSDPSLPTIDVQPSSSSPPPDISSDFDYPDSDKFSSPILKYINDVLMEEDDFERKPCMLQDCLAIQAAERSLYDVIGQNYPPPSETHTHCFNDGNQENPDSNIFSTFSTGSSISHCSDFSCESNSNCNLDYDSSSAYSSLLDSLSQIVLLADVGPTISCGIQPAVHNRGGNFEMIDLEASPPISSEHDESSGNMVEKVKEDVSYVSERVLREKKTHQREESDYEGVRGSKQSAVYHEDCPAREMLDDVLLYQAEKTTTVSSDDGDRTSRKGKSQQNGQSKGSNGKTRSKKEASKGELVDLWTLLTQCAQAVASYDQRTATDLLKQIRQHSSPYGDGMQRLAHYFANGLETRLEAGSPSYLPYASDGATAADILKAYKLYITSCPFKRMSNFLANRTIMKVAEKATRLHIIDFGILYGFQWPCLIQRLSERQGGPPILRITGIELPQPGFRPSERVEKTGKCLANYCKRFSVPFEYNFIAKKWETVQLDDLKIDRSEVTVVNCLHRLKNLPDETVAANSPRDEVLRLIRRINPDIFIHGVVNGTYNAPFFTTRFREALFHFSSLFDMFEATVSREDPQRLMFEKEVFARDAINVIACEGAARVERPETYKQWQARNQRVGFKQIPLCQEIVNKVKEKVRVEYHKDFVVDGDGKWMLQGWKGRIVHAISCWKPL